MQSASAPSVGACWNQSRALTAALDERMWMIYLCTGVLHVSLPQQYWGFTAYEQEWRFADSFQLVLISYQEKFCSCYSFVFRREIQIIPHVFSKIHLLLIMRIYYFDVFHYSFHKWILKESLRIIHKIDFSVRCNLNLQQRFFILKNRRVGGMTGYLTFEVP